VVPMTSVEMTHDCIIGRLIYDLEFMNLETT
jgi:hypothetical protein